VAQHCTYDERINIFHEIYGNEGDPAVTLGDYVKKAGDVLCAIVGEDLGNLAMHQIAGPLGTERPAEEWREALDDSEGGFYSEWVMGARLHGLLAYARYGILLSAEHDDETDQIEAAIQDLLGEATDLIQQAPPAVWLGELRAKDLENYTAMAQGRWALDHQDAIPSEALALLGGVSLSRMRGMMTGENALFQRDANKKIPFEEALAWLETRDEYYPSIWRDQRPGEDMPQDDGESDQIVSNPIFVPASADGSYFSPKLRMEKGYQIGVEGKERFVEDFDEALDQLTRMSPPTWRRPSATSGRFGRVVSTKWIRMTREELFQ